MTQPQIDRLFALEARATRLGHLGWAARLHERAVWAIREARFAAWMETRRAWP